MAQLYSVKQVADVLGLKPATIRAWLIRRKLPRVNCGRAVRIPAQAVADFIAANTIPTALRPEDFPIGSLESRVAARAMLDARQAGGVRVHIEVVGDPRPCLLCPCNDCRRWWAAHPEERAEEELEHQKFLDSFKAAPVQQQDRQEQQPTVQEYCEERRVSQAPSSHPAAPRRGYPLTRTGAAMAFLRGGGSR